VAIPTYFGFGTFTAGAATIQPPFPASTLADDIALLVCESENQAITLSIPQGFAEVLNSPQGTGTAGSAGSTRLAVFWKRLVGGDTAPTVADSGDHTTGQIHVFRGCKTVAAALALDNFNRANENPLGNGVWSTVTGLSAMQVASNIATPSNLGADCGSRYSGISWPNDQYSRAKLTVNGTVGVGAGIALYVRVAAAANTGYRLTVDHAATNNVFVKRFNAGTPTTLTGFPVTQSWSDGATWELRVTGSQVQVFLNGVQVGPTVTDTNIASGSPGIGYSSTETSGSVEDWEGGDPTVPWNVTAGGVEASSDTSALVPGATTTVADCLVALLYSSSNDATSTTNFSAQANADLASITEQTDNTNTIGLGGGHGLTTGTKAVAGSYTTTAVTYAAASLKGMMSIALAPASNNIVVTPGLGAPVFAGFAAAALLTIRIATGLGAPVFTGFAPTVIATNNIVIPTGVGAPIFAGQSPAVQIGSNTVIQPGTGQPVFTGFGPTILVTVKIPVGLGQPVFTGLAPTVAISNNIKALPGLGAPTFAGFAPSVVAAVTAKPGLGQPIFTGFAPSLVFSDNQRALAGLGQPVFTGIAPTVLIGTGQAALATPGVGRPVFTGFAPVVLGSLQNMIAVHRSTGAIPSPHRSTGIAHTFVGESITRTYTWSSDTITFADDLITFSQHRGMGT
jgi:hypothetical protein